MEAFVVSYFLLRGGNGDPEERDFLGVSQVAHGYRAGYSVPICPNGARGPHPDPPALCVLREVE